MKLKNSILQFSLFALFCNGCVIAQDSDWLFERRSNKQGAIYSAPNQTIEIWFDIRNFSKSKILPFLISNKGPGDMFVCEKAYWMIKDRSDNSRSWVSSSLPRKYCLLSPSKGVTDLRSVALLTAKGLSIPRIINIKDKQKFVLILQIIGRSDGESHLIEVDFDAGGK